MASRPDLDTIDLRLVRVLHTVLTERSVSRAALRLSSSQPAVSAQLRRLRALTGDPLLVRAGQRMQPTATALELLEPASRLLQEADRLFGARARRRSFEAARAEGGFRVAASDSLAPLFLPVLVAHLQRAAPGVRLELVPLSAEYDYRRALAAGDVDLVIGNWLRPPEELHLGRLISDEVVCLVADDHPAARAGGRGWTVARYLECAHVAPVPLSPGAGGVIDEHLAAQGARRRIAVRASHFGLIPAMVADSWLVLTTGRLFCSRYVETLPVRIVRCPVAFPPLTSYQLWHELAHEVPAQRWLREEVRDVARQLPRRADARSRAVADAHETA
ncbi:MAG: LysR substrate-binding domain-containing protein [Pseudomonadota bacterium]